MKKRVFTSFLLSICNIGLISTLASSELSSSVVFNPHLFTLPNGLTIIIEEDHSVPIATVQAWCATGSIDEGVYLGAGLSHVVEHMLFKGTVHRPPGCIAEEVRHQGGSINAYTFSNKTSFIIDVPSAGVTNAINILADAMMNATFPLAEYNKEQEVIRREFAMRADNPEILGWELLCRTAYRVSPLREPVIGRLDIYNKLTIDEVIDYYRQRYVPNNICFIIVGDVNAEKIREQLTALFKNNSCHELKPVTIKREPPQLTKRIARETFPMKESFLNIAWKGPFYQHADTLSLKVLAAILGAGKSSRLYQELREKKELVHSIGAGLDPATDLIYVRATADLSKRVAAEAEILHQVDLLKTRGVTNQEVKRAQKLLLASHYCELENVNGRASAYGNSWLATGDPCYQEDFFEAMKRITPKEVNRVARQYLVEDKLTITSLDPQPADASASQNKTNSVKSENIESKLQQGMMNDIKKFTLPNGLRLLIHEDHRLPLVSITALFRGGVMAENEKRSGLTQLLARTITKGTRSQNEKQIAQMLEQVGGTMTTNSDNDSFGIYINVLKPDFKLGLNLLADLLREPLFSRREIDKEKINQLAAFKIEDDQISTAACRVLQKNLFGTHPYARSPLGTPESVKALTPEMVQEFYKQLVVGKNGVIAIFGDVKTEEVLAEMGKTLAALPSGALALQSVCSPIPLETSLYENLTQQREQSIVMKGFLGASKTSLDRPALELLSVACNGWGSRFFKEMRDKRGLVYFVGNWNMMGMAPGNIIFLLGADPKRSTLAREELEREIHQLVQSGLNQEELDQAKNTLLKNLAQTHQSNERFGNKIAADELMGLGFEHDQHEVDEIKKVTLEQVNRVIKKYLGVPGSVEVVIGPAVDSSARQHR